MNELKTRGVEDVTIAIVDGLKGFDAGASAYAHRTRLELDDFADGLWGQNYLAIVRSWRRNWPEAIAFFAFPDDVRRILYTPNAIESWNAKLHRAIGTTGHFPTGESVLKLLFLVLNLAANEGKMPPRK